MAADVQLHAGESTAKHLLLPPPVSGEHVSGWSFALHTLSSGQDTDKSCPLVAVSQKQLNTSPAAAMIYKVVRQTSFSLTHGFVFF